MRRALATCAALALLGGGCGGSGTDRGEDLGQGGDRRPDRVLVAALGDSITAGSPAWDPDAGVREQLGTGADPESQYEYWAQLHLGRGVEFRNCGVFGERTDEIAARLGACARGAQVLIVQGGINDVVQGRPVAEAARDLRAMVRRGRALGLRVVLVDVLPWNNGGPGPAREIRALNELIRGIGRDEDVPVLAWNAALADRRDPDRMADALTSDGDHPSVAGYRKLGELVELPR
jgi:lysophospholipase L1-like esterase